MALIVMAVHDTEENGRSAFTEATLKSIMQTVDLKKNRLVIVDNGSCNKTKLLVSSYTYLYNNVFSIINESNIGTAKAVNKGIKMRQPKEYVIKMDNDVTFGCTGWVEQMEEVIDRQTSIGILGLKRKDLMESPYAINTDQRSRLMEVPHEVGQRWYVIEAAKHIMGTCTMLNHLLLDRVGYFYQMGGLYGFDDSLLCVRSQIAGFINCFLHGIEIEHIDPGGTDYTKWKEKAAGEILSRYGEEEAAYVKGLKDVYYED